MIRYCCPHCGIGIQAIRQDATHSMCACCGKWYRVWRGVAGWITSPVTAPLINCLGADSKDTPND